ncbi:MAG TPA: GNAT family N-acetyltransferase [Caulobacteraceae bacterium]|nr:GNAT family N-acetyltransferase [Caulobacteraceae bacterium]
MIRPARPSDIPALDAIEQSGAETFAAYGEPLADGSPPAAPGHWEAVLASGLLWIADHAEAGPVGFLAAERVGGGLYVAEVDVTMAHQKHGYGRRLMRAAIDWARGEGLSDVTLTTFRDIPWNAPFYASLGFVELADAAMPPHLAEHLADEAERGFEGRCGMRLAL